MKKQFIWLSLILYQSSNAVCAESPDKVVSASDGITMQNITETLVALLLVTVTIFVCAWFLKKLNPHFRNRSYGKKIKVLTRLPIGTREQLVVIEVYEQHFLLGVTPNGISLIKELTNLPTENT